MSYLRYKITGAMSLLVIIFNPIKIYGQTMSRILSPLEPDTIPINYNKFIDIKASNSAIYFGFEYFRANDVNKNTFLKVGGVAKYNYQGDIMKRYLFDDVRIGIQNSLYLNKNSILMVGKSHSETGYGAYAFELDLRLNILDSVYISVQDGYYLNPNGIELIGQNYIINGNAKNLTTKKRKSFIKSYDGNWSLNWQKLYSRSNVNYTHDLQSSPNGYIYYCHNFYDRVGAGDVDGYQIMKLNSKGQKIDSFELTVSGITTYPILLSDGKNDIYFSTFKFPDNRRLPTDASQGVINKLHPDMDSILWSIAFPFTAFKNHNYGILDLAEAHNGDILVCGAVWDASKDVPVQGEDNNYSGFISRLDTEGNIKWLRFYRVPNEHPSLLPYKKYGKLRPSVLYDIQELDDGRILVGGHTYWNNSQWDYIDENRENLFELWMMIVDENGCIDGEECQDVIFLDGEEFYTNFLWEQSSNWEYCYTEDNLEKQYMRASLEVIDTHFKYGMQGYLLAGDFVKYDSGLADDAIWIYDNGSNQIYYEMEDTIHLLMDFDLAFYDTLRVKFPHIIDPAFRALYPDRSDTLEWLVGPYESVNIDGRWVPGHQLYALNGTDTVVETGKFLCKGLGYGSWFLPYLKNPNTGEFPELRLAEFHSDTLDYQAISEDCITSINDKKNLNSDITLYPNPSNNTLRIKTTHDIVKMQIVDLYGQVLEHYDSMHKIDITSLPSGMYLLRVETSDNEIYTSQFIKQ